MKRKFLYRLVVVILLICLFVTFLTVKLIIQNPEKKVVILTIGFLVEFTACIVSAKLIVNQSKREQG